MRTRKRTQDSLQFLQQLAAENDDCHSSVSHTRLSTTDERAVLTTDTHRCDCSNDDDDQSSVHSLCSSSDGGLQCEPPGGSLCRTVPDVQEDHVIVAPRILRLDQRRYPRDHYAPDCPLIDIRFEDLGLLCNLTPTRKHIKGNQVPMVRQCYVHLMGQLQHSNNAVDATLWKKLLLVNRVLLTPVVEEMQWTMARRCEWVMADDWSHFTLSSFKTRPFRDNHNAMAGDMSEEDFVKVKVRRARNLLTDGEIARAFKAVQAKRLPTPSSVEVFQRMLDLHPPSPDGSTHLRTVRPPNAPQLELDPTLVRKMISQAKKSISPCSITCIRYELLKQLMGAGKSEDETTFLEKLTWLLTMIFNGKVPRDALVTCKSTQGAAIGKGPVGIRPLGMRETLVNLSLKVGQLMSKGDITALFEGLNYALAGSKKMDELIALMANAMRARPDHDRIFIDAKNAFNLISREKAMEAICAECPQLSHIFHALYNGPTPVWLRNENDEWTTLHAEQGCVQGCVSGPLVFGFGSLGAYRATSASLAGCEDAFFGAYSDDGSMSAEHNALIRAFKVYLREGAQCGIHINFAPGKTEVLLGVCESMEEVERRINNFERLGIPRSNIKVHPVNGGDPATYGYIHLGVPVGSRLFKTNALRDLILDFRTMCHVVHEMRNPQDEWVMLYWVLRQKFPFWLRHMCPSVTLELIPQIEEAMRLSMVPVVGHLFGDDEWEQMCLPIKSHGFGLGKTEDVVSAAYVANVQETRAHVCSKLPSAAVYLNAVSPSGHHQQRDNDEPRWSPEIAHFVTIYRQHKDRISEAARQVDFDLESHFPKWLQDRKLQFGYTKILSSVRVADFRQRINATGAPKDKARMHSTNGSLAGAWLLSVPKTQHSTIGAQAFRMSCHLRLGLPFLDLPTFCKCNRHEVVDRWGTHIFACVQFRSLLKSRHDAIQNDFKALANSAGIRADDRRLTVFRVIQEDDGKRPDLLLPGFGEDGKDLLLDFTIGHPTCGTYVEHAATTPNYTLLNLHARKNTKYLQRCTEIGASFMPMAFESFGAASDQVMDVMKRLVSRAAESTNIPFSILYSYWKKRFSTTLQVQNTRILLMASTSILAQSGRREEAFDPDVLLESVHNVA